MKRKIEKTSNPSTEETISSQPVEKKPKTEETSSQAQKDTKPIESDEKDNGEGTLSLLCDYGSDEDD